MYIKYRILLDNKTNYDYHRQRDELVLCFIVWTHTKTFMHNKKMLHKYFIHENFIFMHEYEIPMHEIENCAEEFSWMRITCMK